MHLGHVTHVGHPRGDGVRVDGGVVLGDQAGSVVPGLRFRGGGRHLLERRRAGDCPGGSRRVKINRTVGG